MEIRELFKEVVELCENYTNAKKEIERLTCESTKWESKFYDEVKKVNNAIEFIDRYLRLNLKAFNTKDLLYKILEILEKVEK